MRCHLLLVGLCLSGGLGTAEDALGTQAALAGAFHSGGGGGESLVLILTREGGLVQGADCTLQ